MLILNPDQELYCENMLRKDEGFKQYPYKDTKGNWTIGYGTNMENFIDFLEEYKQKGISKETAILWLRYFIDSSKNEIANNIPWSNDITPPKKIALINMCYNMGIVKLLEFKKFLNALQDNDLINAQKELLNSKWASQVGLRAERISVLICSQGEEYVKFGFDKCNQ